MKVILLRDVAKIGRRNDIVELPDGYALNQLIPKKWAEPATPVNLKKIAANKALSAAQDEAVQSRFDAAVAALETNPAIIRSVPNEQGHLFKAVNEMDIIEAAKERGVVLEKTWVHLKEQIKALGVFEITLKHGKKEKTIQIEVIKK